MTVLKSVIPAGIAIGAAMWLYPNDILPKSATENGSLTVAARSPSSGRSAERDQRGRVRVVQRRFDVGPGGTLRIDIPDGDVEVETSASGSGVEVEVFLSSRDMEWARERFDRMEFEAGATGNTVTVTARRVRTNRSDWGRGRGPGFAIVTRVTVPQRFNADISTEDGDIFLGDLDGSVVLNSSDGDIELGHIRGDELSIETSDGDITADAIEAKQTEIRTSDGDIDIGTAGGAIRATTSDGDIRMRLTQGGDVRLRTSDGDITIYAPMSLKAEIDFDGEDLNIDRGFAILGRLTRRRVSGTLNGGGPLIQAGTHDGSITLRESGR